MFDIKRPTATVDIVTDLDTLTQAIGLKKSIDEATPDTAGMTDAEICAAKKSADRLRRELKTLLKAVDASTVTFTLRGLGSSQWNQIVAANVTTDPKTGRQSSDVAGMLTDALPDMIIKVEQAGEPVEFDPHADVPALLGMVVDTQTVELISTVQRLNTPQVAVPKALRE
ncbi:hypothetical protein [Bifidobacterium castoris]|uniref:Uncharacterized protein n=1 Tax=Bifidobacterium castoris TaxID=2306972 RepID=A0A430F8E8_9BIFI|nr:hypothetical protein [Bifidobacterium castoris]RSX48938.1 hypothetical protein D2E22_1076 [Bifidobacterium castoris]